MKSLNRGNTAGQHVLKGKLTKRLSCGCCTLINLKQKDLDYQHTKEVEYGNNDDVDLSIVQQVAFELGKDVSEVRITWCAPVSEHCIYVNDVYYGYLDNNGTCGEVE